MTWETVVYDVTPISLRSVRSVPSVSCVVKSTSTAISNTSYRKRYGRDPVCETSPTNTS